MAADHNPMTQFEVKPILDIALGSYDLSFTNSSLWMLISVATIVVFFLVATRKRAIRPGRLQIVAELLYGTVHTMVRDNIGREGMRYFPTVLTLFLFILFGNALGLIPGSFTFTSHLAVTFALAGAVFIGVTVLGLVRHKARFFSFFIPHGTPLLVAPFLMVIEVISYLSRPLSLSVRLFSNMAVGHILLKVVAGFVISLGVFGFVPWLALIAVYMLEMLVACIHAYVFAILTCVYIRDALYLH